MSRSEKPGVTGKRVPPCTGVRRGVRGLEEARAEKKRLAGDEQEAEDDPGRVPTSFRSRPPPRQWTQEPRTSPAITPLPWRISRKVKGGERGAQNSLAREAPALEFSQLRLPPSAATLFDAAGGRGLEGTGKVEWTGKPRKRERRASSRSCCVPRAHPVSRSRVTGD